LKHLAFLSGLLDLIDILPEIGRNLISLEYTSLTSYLESVDTIVEFCPNLQILSSIGVYGMIIIKLRLWIRLRIEEVGEIKSKWEVYSIGTDWEGYR
jgi:hypothetical protein